MSEEEIAKEFGKIKQMDYRIFENERNFETFKEYYYDIHEVYYDEQNNIFAWTVEPVTPYFEYFSDIERYQDGFIEALSKKIVKYDEETETLVELDKYIKNIK